MVCDETGALPVTEAGMRSATGGRGADTACGGVLRREGFSAVAASTALATVFTACRAPSPSTRPNRTASIATAV